MEVRPKKHLGQHFLTDMEIAANITGLLSLHETYKQVLEIGPGMGILTDLLLKNPAFETFMIEVDEESVIFLKKKYPDAENRIIYGDFLKADLGKLFSEKFALIGNFPYNISSQILFKVLDYKEQIPEIVGMFQREVARRIASPPGNKDYGILSVLMQAYYTVEYCFTVQEDVFNPPPKVKSGVLRLRRNAVQKLECNEVLFKKIVKQGFHTRRKTLRNALKPMGFSADFYASPVLDKRAEQLDVAAFVRLTQAAEAKIGAVP